MQVSNSTGRNTDYRVNASGGGGGSNVAAASGTSSTATMVGAMLSPGDIELCLSSWPCKVEFVIDGIVVAWKAFDADPGQVALVETNGLYDIVITPLGDDTVSS